MGVNTATASTGSRCDTSAATGLPMDRPAIAIVVAWGRNHRSGARTSERARITPATLASGSIVGYGGHASRRTPQPGCTGSAMFSPSSF